MISKFIIIRIDQVMRTTEISKHFKPERNIFTSRDSLKQRITWYNKKKKKLLQKNNQNLPSVHLLK